MLVLRIARVCLHLFAGLLTCAVVFPWLDGAGRNLRIQRWSIQLLTVCGVEVEVTHRADGPMAPRALIAANHISWLDIFVINSLHTCRFVAKADVRAWPLIGWLCYKSGTVFIARGKLREVRRIYEGLVHSLEAGEHMAFFPEGTTSEQGTVLPFHANLFEAAIEARVPVQPFAVRYVDADGKPHPAVTFVGDTSFAQSLVAILKGGRIRAELVRLPLIDTAGLHRRDLAKLAHDAVANSLDLRRTSSPERSAA